MSKLAFFVKRLGIFQDQANRQFDLPFLLVSQKYRPHDHPQIDSHTFFCNLSNMFRKSQSAESVSQELEDQNVGAMPQSVQMKLCRRCNTHKPVTQFYKSKANADGYDGRCKTCDAVQCAQRRRRKERVEVYPCHNMTCKIFD